MNRKLNLVLLLVIGITLTACGGKDTGVEPKGGGGNNVPTTTSTDDSNAWNTGYSKAQLEALGIMGNPLNYKVVYFEYNSSAIDERSRIIAGAHARNLASRGGARVSLEGHADERGTRDYNLALGERRGQAVAQLMSAVGAGNSSIQTISYGEERPANTAHNEAAWKENRRVEISY